MNQKQLERKVRYWQKILKLDHWEITCQLAHSNQTDGSMGVSYSQGEYFTSHFKIENPQHLANPKEYIEDGGLDRTIIHELLHCHLNTLIGKTTGFKRKILEMVVTNLEKVIYDLHKEIYE